MTGRDVRDMASSAFNALAMCFMIVMAIGGLGMIVASIWGAVVLAGEP